MKKTLLFLMIIFALSSSAQEMDYRSITPPKGKSLVYVIRPSIYGFAVGFKTYANGQYMGETYGKNYLYTIIEPGSHIITNSSENNSTIKFTTEPDKTYFLKQKVQTGLVTARSDFELLSETEGRKALMKCGLSKSNTYSNNPNSISSTSETIATQTTRDESIDNVSAEVRNDSLIISFDLNNLEKIQSLWVEIRTVDGKKIVNNSLDAKRWKTVASVANSKVVWAYALDKVDLAGQDISIDVKANVASAEEQVAVIPAKPIKEKVKETAKYPLFRMGVEIVASAPNPDLNTNFFDDFGSGNISYTFEYIAKPQWSILSGIGYQQEDRNECTYNSILVPLTAEYKFNGGRWFRFYAGGGIQNRYLIYEDDRYLNFGHGLNRYILSWKAEAGFEIRNIRIGATYTSDITPISTLDDKMSYLGLSVGWRFGGSRAYIRK